MSDVPGPPRLPRADRDRNNGSESIRAAACDDSASSGETSAANGDGAPGPLPPPEDRGDGSSSMDDGPNLAPRNGDGASPSGVIFYPAGFEEDPGAFDHWEEPYQGFLHWIRGIYWGDVTQLTEKRNLPPNKKNSRGILLFNERACLQIGKYLAMGKGGLIASRGSNRPRGRLEMTSMGLNGEALKALFFPFTLLKNVAHRGVVVQADLSGNRKIGPSGIVGISPILQSSDLQHLNISNVCLGDQGAEALASILRDCADRSRLEYLDVSFNKVKDKGARELARALQHVPSLKRLNLSCNCIREYSSLSPILVAEDGSANLTLGVLELCGNPIDDECLSCLAENLRGNHGQTTRLVFANNKHVTFEGLASLFGMLHNVSDFGALQDSNHSLTISFEKGLCPKLLRALAGASEINGTKLSQRMKVWRKFFAQYLPRYFHLCQEIESLDGILIPQALAWVASERRVHPPLYQCHDVLYHVLRKLPTHWL